MSIKKNLEVRFTCDECGDSQKEIYPIAPDAEVPRVIPPKNWTTLTINEESTHYCSKCWESKKPRKYTEKELFQPVVDDIVKYKNDLVIENLKKIARGNK